MESSRAQFLSASLLVFPPGGLGLRGAEQGVQQKLW